ncbi:MAG: hypothetical protein CVU31_02645 [Betaproteobacteria bacterium HGW-Betaproteobacteria-4]|nr:MAG: hypothetical protein CVU31_02645 [Betaproteobacteria bacterium HGW-Betaproteobacteria-4]
MLSDWRKDLVERNARMKADRPAGEAALRRLLPIAQRDTDQSGRVARILLGLYNGHRFPLNLTNLRSLDDAIFEDVIAVLRMDANAYQEVHLYFENGGRIFEKLADDWGMNEKARES